MRPDLDALQRIADRATEQLVEFGAASALVVMTIPCGDSARSYTTERGNPFANMGAATAYIRDRCETGGDAG